MATDRQIEIIKAISEEILEAAHSCAAEQHCPQRPADDMDDFIRQRQGQMADLRRVREDLERIFTGALR